MSANPQKITHDLPLSKNRNATLAEHAFVKRTPDGWNVCVTTATGARYQHFHAFPAEDRAQRFAEKVLERKTIQLEHWKEMGRFA